MSPTSFMLSDASEASGVFYIASAGFGPEVDGPFRYVRASLRQGCVVVRLAEQPHSKQTERLYDLRAHCFTEWADATEAVAAVIDAQAVKLREKAAAMRGAAKAARSAR